MSGRARARAKKKAVQNQEIQGTPGVNQSSGQPAPVETPAPAVETPVQVETPASAVETPVRVETQAPAVETPVRVESPAPAVETPVRVETPAPENPSGDQNSGSGKPGKKKKERTAPKGERNIPLLRIIIIVMAALVVIAIIVLFFLQTELTSAIYRSLGKAPALPEAQTVSETAAAEPEQEEEAPAAEETEEPAPPAEEPAAATLDTGTSEVKTQAFDETEALEAYIRVLNTALEKNFEDHYHISTDADRKLITISIWYDGIAEEYSEEPENEEEKASQAQSWEVTKSSIDTMARDFYQSRLGLMLDDYHIRTILLSDLDHDVILLTFYDGGLAYDAYETRFSGGFDAPEEPPALVMAKELLDGIAFSYNGLFQRLMFAGFSHEDALYAVDNCGADWNEEAVRMARSYAAQSSSITREKLIDQLKYEGFTDEQASYGADHVEN